MLYYIQCCIYMCFCRISSYMKPLVALVACWHGRPQYFHHIIINLPWILKASVLTVHTADIYTLPVGVIVTYEYYGAQSLKAKAMKWPVEQQQAIKKENDWILIENKVHGKNRMMDENKILNDIYIIFSVFQVYSLRNYFGFKQTKSSKVSF